MLETLRDSERQFRLLVEGVTDYALFMLDPNGVVTSWNAGAKRIKGFAAGEIIGQHFSRFYCERDRAAGVPARALQIAAADGRYEAEGWRLRKNGDRFWANVVLHPIRDEHGNLAGFAKITQDITEKRDAEIALQKAQEHRGRAQRMEALGAPDRRRCARLQQSPDDHRRLHADAQETGGARPQGASRHRGDR